MIIILSIFFSYLFCMMYLNAVGFFDDIFLNSNENIIVSMFKFIVAAIFPYIVAPYIFYQRNGNLFVRRNKPINPCVVVEEQFDIERITVYEQKS